MRQLRRHCAAQDYHIATCYSGEEGQESPEERKRIEATYGERILERYMNILDNNNFWKTVAPCCRHQDSRLQTCSVQSPVPELPVSHRASGQAKP